MIPTAATSLSLAEQTEDESTESTEIAPLDADKARRPVCILLVQGIFLTVCWGGFLAVFIVYGPWETARESQIWQVVDEDGFQPILLRLVSIILKPILSTVVFGPQKVQARAMVSSCDKVKSWLKWAVRLVYLVMFFVRIRSDFMNVHRACKQATTWEAILASAMVLSRSSNLSSAISTWAVWELVVGHVYWLELHRSPEILVESQQFVVRRLGNIQIWWRYKSSAISVHGYIFVFYGFVCLPYRLCGFILFLLFAVPAMCLWPYIYFLALLSWKVYKKVCAWVLLRVSQFSASRNVQFSRYVDEASQKQVLIASRVFPRPPDTESHRCSLARICINPFVLYRDRRKKPSVWYDIQSRVFRATGATSVGWSELFEKAAIYGAFLPFAVGAAARLYAGESYAVAIASAGRGEPGLREYFQGRLRSFQRLVDTLSILV